jgi:hypothetical protein
LACFRLSFMNQNGSFSATDGGLPPLLW